MLDTYDDRKISYDDTKSLLHRAFYKHKEISKEQYQRSVDSLDKIMFKKKLGRFFVLYIFNILFLYLIEVKLDYAKERISIVQLENELRFIADDKLCNSFIKEASICNDLYNKNIELPSAMIVIKNMWTK